MLFWGHFEAFSEHEPTIDFQNVYTVLPFLLLSVFNLLNNGVYEIADKTRFSEKFLDF